MATRLAALACLMAVAAPAAAADDAGVEYFEKEVRPILVARCFECHSGKIAKPKGGLRLDSLAAATMGGDTGPAIVPGKPKESLLVDAINYGELYQMPPKSRLPAAEVAILTRWVEIGAPWPQASATASDAKRSDFDLAKRKSEHWCWQPLTNSAVPQIRNPQSLVRNPIDAFIRTRLEEKGLSPAPPADPRTLIRRLYFDLIGLPPSVEEVEAFVAACTSSATEGENRNAGAREKALTAIVDKLLDSPHFGERWGRHWLDLVRYAESRGHEFDYNIPNAFEYRDYVIRALNADVHYDQFVIEHVAGDVLEQPRLHPTEGWNESIIATGFWFLGEWCHSPVDIRKDECDRIDNQIDVFSKTFLGLTVACARCHDHKFDAISQADYYALAGHLQSASYRLTRFTAWEPDRKVAAGLASLDETFRPLVAAEVAKMLDARADELALRLAAEADELAKGELGVLHAPHDECDVIVDYNAPPPGAWLTDGPAFGRGPIRTGQVLLGTDPAAPLEIATCGAARLHPEWTDVAIAAPSEGEQGRLGGWVRAGRALKTPTWTLRSGQVHYLIEGAGHVYAAVDSHAMINGPLHGELAKDTGGNSDLPMRWITHDLSRYAGHRVHLEFSPKEGEDFRVLKVVEGPLRPKPPETSGNRLCEQVANVDRASREEECRKLVRRAGELVRGGAIAAERDAADWSVLAGWLVARCDLASKPQPEVKRLIEQYAQERRRLLAGAMTESRVCLAMWEGTPVDENVLIRGNHKTPGPVVPRRLPEALASGAGLQPAANTSGSGTSGAGLQPASRLELARQLVDPANPLTSRVMVNRVWHHLFGRGIVPSVDNFGVLGQLPTHPQLLDYLAQQFIRDGWSLKRLIRSIVLSQTYQQESGAGLEPARKAAEAADPQNLLFHRQNLRRLEGEALRDAILAISGRLDRTQFGPSVLIYLTPFMQGRGRPGASGPLDGGGRRSIYIAVRRNFLSPMMLAFDTPIPFSTVGRRNVSNVPAQALILMNDPFVAEQAQVWAKKLLADKNATTQDRIRRMYLEAVSREPTAAELSSALLFLAEQAREYGLSEPGRAERVWADLGHVLYNVKEFSLIE
jgi:cytochrome c553